MRVRPPSLPARLRSGYSLLAVGAVVALFLGMRGLVSEVRPSPARSPTHRGRILATDNPARVARELFSAWAAKDWGAVCARLDPLFLSLSGSKCERALALVFAKEAQELRYGDLAKTTRVHGRAAFVRVEGTGRTRLVVLVKQVEGWRVVTISPLTDR